MKIAGTVVTLIIALIISFAVFPSLLTSTDSAQVANRNQCAAGTYHLPVAGQNVIDGIPFGWCEVGTNDTFTAGTDTQATDASPGVNQLVIVIPIVLIAGIVVLVMGLMLGKGRR